MSAFFMRRTSHATFPAYAVLAGAGLMAALVFVWGRFFSPGESSESPDFRQRAHEWALREHRSRSPGLDAAATRLAATSAVQICLPCPATTTNSFVALTPSATRSIAPAASTARASADWFPRVLRMLRPRSNAMRAAQAKTEADFMASYPTDFKLEFAIAERFPLPEQPMLMAGPTGAPWFGAEGNIAGGRRSSFSPDCHIRDLLSSVFLKCALASVWKEAPCFALDIGSNFGLHLTTALRFGARMLAIEPQTDLCLASKYSVARMGKADDAVILCGGVAADNSSAADAELTDFARNYRYGGGVAPTVQPPVPIYTLHELTRHVPAHVSIKMAKIDTDTVDCAILKQFVDLMDAGQLQPVQNFVLEAWDPTCHTLGATLIRLEKRGYTIFRTKVTERSWNDNNVETKNGFAPVNKDPAWVEQFFQRFNLVLWRAQRGKVDWIKKAPLFGSEWQIFATLDDYQTHGYQTSFM